MYRYFIQKYCKFNIPKRFFCKSVTEQQAPKEEIINYEKKIIRPFTKDMLINYFNMDLFVFPEIDNNVDVDRVNNLCDKLENFLKVLNETLDDDKKKSIIEQLSHSGIFGLCLPELYDGHRFNNMMLAKVVEVMANDMRYLFNTFIPRNLGSQALFLAGTEEQKAEYLKKLTVGQIKATVAVHESNNDFINLENINTSVFHDKESNMYVIDGKKTLVKGLYDCDYVIVFAKTVENEVRPFLVDLKSEGIKIQPYYFHENNPLNVSTCSLELNKVQVPANNIMNSDSKNKTIKHLAAIENCTVAAACSGLIRELLRKANEFAYNQAIFGKPLIKFEKMQYYFLKFTDEAYSAESVAFQVAGSLDYYTDNDSYLDTCLAKLNNLSSLERSLNMFFQILGNKALTGDDPELTMIYEQIQILLYNQTSSMENKLSMSKEALDYILTNLNLENKKFDLNDFCMKLGILKVKCVIEDKFVLPSFDSNLHPRVGKAAEGVCGELNKLFRFLMKFSKSPSLLYEDIFLLNLIDIWKDMYCLIAVMCRASRSIAIGLRNHEMEVHMSHFHAKHLNVKLTDIMTKINQYPVSTNENNRISEAIKQMGGCFIDQNVMK